MNFDCVIKNGRIWNGFTFLENVRDVAIKDGKIAEIGEGLVSAPLVFDAKGGIISCGLVDIHTHMKGCSNDSFGIPAEMVCFPFGVTTAVEAAADRDGILILDNMWLDTFVFLGVSIVNNHAVFTNVENFLTKYNNRVLGVKVFFDTSSPNVIDGTPLKEICEYARSRNLKTLVHSTGSPISMKEVFEILSEGDICTHIFHGGKNNVSDDDFSCMEYARKKGVVLDNGMAGGVHTDFSVAQKAIKKGVLPDSIATDITRASAFMRGGNYGLTMCMSIMRTLGMKEEDVLKCVTFSAAKAIGKEKEFGQLQVGKQADVCVLQYTNNPFEMNDRWGNIVKDSNSYVNLLTIKKGRVVFRGNI